jgi:hypothetical protein
VDDAPATTPTEDLPGEEGDGGAERTNEPCDNRGPGNCRDRGRDDDGGHSG